MKTKYKTALGVLAGVLVLSSFKKSAGKTDVSAPEFQNLVINASKSAFGVLDGTQIESIRSITDAFARYGDGDGSKLAYILATAWHESWLRPIKEFRANAGTTLYTLQNNYWNTGYYGRGFVQLTWKENYQKMSNFLNLDLVSNPDLVLQPDIAAKIIVYGMINGSFTRRSTSQGGQPYKLSDFINPNLPSNDFYNARRIVNGLDRAQLINDYAINIVNYNEAV